MQQLTGLDAAFLALDSATAVPPFWRRLARVPFGLDQRYWIEDADFDIEFHLRELTLAAPGDDRQLATQAARLHARPLDRGRPLWKLYLIHGLQGGRFAKYTSATYTLAMYTSAPYTSAPHTSATYRKVHPAAIDGVDRVVDELAVSQKMQAGG